MTMGRTTGCPPTGTTRSAILPTARMAACPFAAAPVSTLLVWLEPKSQRQLGGKVGHHCRVFSSLSINMLTGTAHSWRNCSP